MNRENVDKTKIIPFRFSYMPLKKLALLNYKKNEDDTYVGLEPQIVLNNERQEGFRVIAYRTDGYVDVYDDMTIDDDADDSFDVTGKGLCERKKVAFENTNFSKERGCLALSFQFTDKYDRRVVVEIIEQAKKPSKGLHLLAPIGVSTENPSYLPVFFLYDFDFIRKQKTKVNVTVDGKSIKLANFPFPLLKDFQLRYYARYSADCQIIEFANATEGVLQDISADAEGTFTDGGCTFDFAEDGSLVTMAVRDAGHPLVVSFANGFPDVRTMGDGTNFQDQFKISASDSIGYIDGEYTVKREGNAVKIELIPSGGWHPVPNSLFTKIMFGEKSMFCKWPKSYKYTQKIDLETLYSSSCWERIK